MAWSSYQPQHQVRIQPDKGPTLAENAFFSSTRTVCWGWPQQELWLQVGWQGHHLQHYSSSMISSCTLILDSKSRAAAKSTAARFIEDLEHSQNQRVGHSEILSWPGRYLSIFYQSQADIRLSFIKARQIFSSLLLAGQIPFQSITWSSSPMFLKPKTKIFQEERHKDVSHSA